ASDEPAERETLGGKRRVIRRLGHAREPHGGGDARQGGCEEEDREADRRGVVRLEETEDEAARDESEELASRPEPFATSEPGASPSRWNEIADPGAPWRSAEATEREVGDRREKDDPAAMPVDRLRKKKDEKPREGLQESRHHDDRLPPRAGLEKADRGDLSQGAQDERERRQEPELAGVRSEPDRERREEGLADPEHHGVGAAVENGRDEAPIDLLGGEVAVNGGRSHEGRKHATPPRRIKVPFLLGGTSPAPSRIDVGRVKLARSAFHVFGFRLDADERAPARAGDVRWGSADRRS